jgi:hypothetical protein
MSAGSSLRAEESESRSGKKHASITSVNYITLAHRPRMKAGIQ